jgi:predicted  nucleic acid-binding Zn-ribbon protein
MCGKVHPDDSPYLMEGCDKCGNKFFFYVREENVRQMEEDTKDLTKSEMREIEEDVREIIPEEARKDDTVVLDLEAIRIVKPGKYMIDVTTLFNQRPVVIRVGSGRYEIDLSTIMRKWKGKIVGEPAKSKAEGARKPISGKHVSGKGPLKGGGSKRKAKGAAGKGRKGK